MNLNLPGGAYTQEHAHYTTKKRKWNVDSGLLDGIASVLMQAGCKSVADMGAGIGHYGETLAALGFGVFSCDGTPGVDEATGGRVCEKDLSKKQKMGMQWDAVMSLEVGQFIPKEREKDFVGNLARHAATAVILTWGTPGQRGQGHVNQKTPEDVAAMLKEHGFVKNDWLTKLLVKKVVDRRLKRRARVYLRADEKFNPIDTRSQPAAAARAVLRPARATVPQARQLQSQGGLQRRSTPAPTSQPSLPDGSPRRKTGGK